MEYKEAKQKFIQSWGNLGSSWGINRTMAQIHALLLISPKPLSAEEMMEALKNVEQTPKSILIIEKQRQLKNLRDQRDVKQKDINHLNYEIEKIEKELD